MTPAFLPAAALPLPRPRPRSARLRRPSLLEPLRRVRPFLAHSRRPEPQAQVLEAQVLAGAFSPQELDCTVSPQALREARRREARVAVVGDTAAGVEALRQLMRGDGYSCLRVARGTREAVDLASSWQPDIVILDMVRPRRGGLRMLKKLAHAAGSRLLVPLLMLSGDSCGRLKLRALRGGAHDFLPRSFHGSQVQLRVRSLLEARLGELERSERDSWLEARMRGKALEVERVQSDIQEARAEAIARLAVAAELHDAETGQHTHRVAQSAAMLAQSMGLPEVEVEMIRLAAPLHDIGKIAIPDALLLKAGRLSRDEWEQMKTHCRIGAQVLASRDGDMMSVAQRIALFHHERWDGAGYPFGLRQEQIPLEARILAVADVFDALTHERPYKHAWPIDEALHEIESQSERQFDPRVVHAFRDLPHEALV